MMFQIGRYAQVTKEGLKTTGRNGRIKTFDRMYVTLIMCDNGQSIRLRREAVTIHHTVLFQRVHDNELGTLLGSHFTPNMTKVSCQVGKSAFIPKFFEVGDYVRFMDNSRMEVGRVAHIDISNAKMTIDYNGRLITRLLTCIRPTFGDVMKERGFDLVSRLATVDEVKKPDDKIVTPSDVREALESQPTIYHLFWSVSGVKSERFFKTRDEMISAISKMNPDIIEDLKYSVYKVKTQNVKVSVQKRFIID